jgi:hypothetical protein
MSNSPDGKRKISKLRLRVETLRQLTRSVLKRLGTSGRHEPPETQGCPTKMELGTCDRACNP